MQGDVTTERRKISFPFYRTIAESDLVGDTHQLKTELWVCDERVAPDKRSKGDRCISPFPSSYCVTRMMLKRKYFGSCSEIMCHDIGASACKPIHKAHQREG